MEENIFKINNLTKNRQKILGDTSSNKTQHGKKVINVICHQGNANLNHNDILLHPCQKCSKTKTEKLTIPSYDNDFAQLYKYFEKLALSRKAEYSLSIHSSNTTPLLRHLPKRNENLCSHQNLCSNIYSGFIHNCQKLEANT